MRRVSLYEAVQAFMGQIHAEGGRVVDEGNPDMPIYVSFGPCKVEMKLADLKRLDRAYYDAFEAKNARGVRKRQGAML